MEKRNTASHRPPHPSGGHLTCLTSSQTFVKTTRSASQSRRPMVKSHEGPQRKIRIKIDPEAETIVSCSTEELSAPHVGKVKTSAYVPGKSSASVARDKKRKADIARPAKVSSPSVCQTSPPPSKHQHVCSSSTMFATPVQELRAENRLNGGSVHTEEIKVPLSEGKLRKPRAVETSSESARKYTQSSRLKCDCGDSEELPCCVRAKAWLDLIYTRRGLRFDYEKNFKQYKDLLDIEPEALNQISIKKDLGRTFPTAKFFADFGEGQAQLERILQAYSLYDCQVGYVQGMNFIAGSLLYHASEEITFWLLVSLVEDYELRDIYLPGIPGLFKHCQIIDVLIFIHNHKVFSHFSKYGMKTDMLVTEWLFSLFASVIVIEKMGLFWDNFFDAGWVFFYKFIINIINKYEDDILKQEDSADILSPIKRRKNTDSSLTYVSDSFLSSIPLVNRLVGTEFWEALIAEAQKVKLNEGQVKELLNTYDPSILTFRPAKQS